MSVLELERGDGIMVLRMNRPDRLNALNTELRALTEEEIFLDLIDEMSPGVLKIQTPFLYVLMPMRISS